MGFCDLPLAGAVCSVGDAADFVTDPGEAIGNWLAKSAGELAATAVDLAAKAVDSTTTVNLNAPWFRDNYETLLPIGLIILVGTFCAQLVRAAFRRDGQSLTQAFTGTASGVLFAFAAIPCTTIALEVVDALSAGLLQAANTDVASAVRRILKVSALLSISHLGWMVSVLAALGAALGAVLYWCVMMVRKVGILVMVTLAVFAGAGGGWEAARRWRKGWIEATVTLVVSKLLMTIIFVLGIAAMGRTETKDGLGALADILAGIVIMVLVLLCPYATFKFVHWAAEGSDGESLHRAGGAGAQVVRQHAERAGRKAAAMTATGGAAAAGAAPQGPDSAPEVGGFPGDIAPHSSGHDQDSTENAGSGTAGTASGLEQSLQPPTPQATDGTSTQAGGTSTTNTPDSSAVAAHHAVSQSAPPTTTPPPQGAAPSPGIQAGAPPSGPSSPPASPTGP
ncbi:ATP-binding protein [Streptomyces sp. BH-SS-21]|uniref:ATP-binding protein n=1 Tax=Streptomyces liliiviolaceus TaxID=2823109 RepID=A0A940Y583_9ACTN|nr:ATP-binding protein [Streptomyces liliiviolaceus]MBQ0855470.1 ATP-binding protein [Streptomyces liliiviolaceus]